MSKSFGVTLDRAVVRGLAAVGQCSEMLLEQKARLLMGPAVLIFGGWCRTLGSTGCCETRLHSLRRLRRSDGL